MMIDLALKAICRRCVWSLSTSIKSYLLSLSRVVCDYKSITAEVRSPGLSYGKNCTCRDCGIDCAATPSKNLKASGYRKWLASRHNSVSGENIGAMRPHQG
jgi:hypothetical protein